MTAYRVLTQAGDPNRRALILPGANYTVQAPLLYFAAEVLAVRGWTAEALVWDGVADAEEAAATYDALLRERVAGGGQWLVVAKSRGTVVLPTAVELRVPGVWLTPLVSEACEEPAVRDAVARLRGTGAPHLFVGSTADPSWDAVALEGAGRVVVIDGADHALMRPGDWRGSLHALALTTSAVDDFVCELGNQRDSDCAIRPRRGSRANGGLL